jgi:hypothetical protein
MQSMCAGFILMVCASVVSDLPSLVLRLVTLSLRILRHEIWRWFILLLMYGSLNTKIPNETADWLVVAETLYIRIVGLK